MFCSRCGSPNDDGAKFCQKCGNALTPAEPGGMPTSATAAPGGAATAAGAAAPVYPTPVDTPPVVRGASAQPVAGKRYAQGKNPTIAVVLSLFIIGVGQFYNGDIKKGAVMLIGAILLGLVTGGIAWLPFVIWSCIDAYQVANGRSALW
ncbi:MAG TPA: zinc ribbon domain-containing protein [Albitalea sp.]